MVKVNKSEWKEGSTAGWPLKQMILAQITGTLKTVSVIKAAEPPRQFSYYIVNANYSKS